MGVPVCFVDWKNKEEDRHQVHQVPVIVLTDKYALIVHKKEIIKVALTEIRFSRWE